jgi:acetoacetyl-CoA synthetase
MEYCSGERASGFVDQLSFHSFSIAELERFWRLLLEWSNLPVEGEGEPVLTGRSCENARFFPNLRLNYAEALLAGDDDCPAVIACHDDASPERITRGQLRNSVSRLAGALDTLGVAAGDRVVAIARNDTTTVVAALAAAAIGASFSAVPPEMGSEAILTRFSQLAPRLLLCHTRATEGTIGEVVERLPTLVGVVTLDNGQIPNRSGAAVYHIADLAATSQPVLQDWPRRLTFNQPLFIVFSSGTTGAPKCIVHGAGGTLLEHVKEHRLHCDIRRGDRLFFHTSCAWMMWNWQLSALAGGAEIVLYDGTVGPDTLWQIVAAERVTHFGTSPAYLKLCQDRGYEPVRAVDLSQLRSVMSTGSILYDSQYDWFASAVGKFPLQSISGGTDILGCFVLGSPNLPVWRGEAQCISLGMDVRALPELGETRDGCGELVCCNPFPSKPLGLFGDADGSRFHGAYFRKNPGLWTHGDYIEITERGTARIHGRSDGVINIRGIRIGPAEIYRVLQDFPEVSQALAVAQEDQGEPGGMRMVLLVTPSPGRLVTPDVTMRIRRAIGRRLTPAHVPVVIAEVAELPVTHSGKLSEIAATAAVNGETARNLHALRNPACLYALSRHPALRRRREGPHRFTLLPDHASLETRLTDIWEELFGISPIRPDDDYFELGGDSLLAATLMAAIEETTGQDLLISALLESRTIAALARLLRSSMAAAPSNIVQVRTGEGRPIFFLPGLSGTVLEQHELLRRMSTPRPLYAMEASGVDPSQAPEERVQAMAATYIKAVRLIQPRGPYALVGYSFGGLVAYEMARRFVLAGEALERVVLLDTGIHPRFLTLGMRFRRRINQIRLIHEGMRGQRLSGRVRYLGREILHLVHGLEVRFGKPGELSLGDTLKLPSHLERVRAACGTAFIHYRPPRFEGEVLFIRASDRPAREVDPVQMWRRVAARLEVEELPGTHFTLLEKPSVDHVAAALLRKLDSLV